MIHGPGECLTTYLTLIRQLHTNMNRLRSSYSPAFHEQPAQHVAHLSTSCALPRTFCASEWTPQRTPSDPQRCADYLRDFPFSSANQLSTTINLSGMLLAIDRIIMKRRSSLDTSYWGALLLDDRKPLA